MSRSLTPLAGDVPASREAARGVHDDASAGALTSALADVEQALRELSTAMHDVAHSVVPPGRIDESVADRYARAARTWPRSLGTPPPSYERQAELLTAFDGAGATLRAAAECSRRAREILTSTVR